MNNWLVYLFIIFPLDYNIRWASERPSRLSHRVLSYFEFLLSHSFLSLVPSVPPPPPHPPAVIHGRWVGGYETLAGGGGGLWRWERTCPSGLLDL